jgi:Putative cyclase
VIGEGAIAAPAVHRRKEDIMDRVLRPLGIAFALLACELPAQAQNRPPWPAGDEIGMANTLGPTTWQRCATYLANPAAKSYELSFPRSNTMPQSPFAVPLRENAKPTVGIPGTRHAFNTDEVASGDPGQQGTQMDALGHFAVLPEAWDGKGEFPSGRATYYGGYPQSDVKPTPDSPLRKLGIDKAPPIITSAVLLDAKAHVGRGSAMQPGQLVTAQDIDAMLKAQGLESRGLLAGDVVYIYTGWGDNWKDPDTEKFYYTKGPGLSYDAAQYIAGKAVVLVALDNPFTDPVAEGFLEGKAAPAAGTPPSTIRTSRRPASTTSRTPISVRWRPTRSGSPAPSSCRCARRAPRDRRCAQSPSGPRRRADVPPLKLWPLTGIARAGSCNQGKTWQSVRSSPKSCASLWSPASCCRSAG